MGSSVRPAQEPNRNRKLEPPEPFFQEPNLGNGRNTVSRVLLEKRELTEFCGKLGEFGDKLGEFALAH